MQQEDSEVKASLDSIVDPVERKKEGEGGGREEGEREGEWGGEEREEGIYLYPITPEGGGACGKSLMNDSYRVDSFGTVLSSAHFIFSRELCLSSFHLPSAAPGECLMTPNLLIG